MKYFIFFKSYTLIYTRNFFKSGSAYADGALFHSNILVTCLLNIHCVVWFLFGKYHLSFREIVTVDKNMKYSQGTLSYTIVKLNRKRGHLKDKGCL